MRSGLAPPASSVPGSLKQVDLWRKNTSDDASETWLRKLVGRRRDIGITRIGSITRLDHVGVPIVQVVRPLSLSNAVSQGKGLSWPEATASAMMEAIESWAGENIPCERLTLATAESLGTATRELYASCLVNEAPKDWAQLPIPWIEGWNLFNDEPALVPSALVDTVYTFPSSHPVMFPRTTTGLGAGRTMLQAIIQAGLEVLERDAIAKARRIPNFFDLNQTSLPDGHSEACGTLIDAVSNAGLLCGLWQAPAVHDLPVFWCHLMERGPPNELVPLPSEGFGCSWTHEDAAAKAILEACQARATAISGAREDLTRHHYPAIHDRSHLAEWREQLSAPWRLRVFPTGGPQPDASQVNRLPRVLHALRRAGAGAAVIVPLLSDQESEVHVVRLVAPPLRLDPRSRQ
ncbi:YcaO-like family protein [Microvirga subterranea]|uniref:Ribosomal protein S12 methylthiotransferase accessory factor n=1 Tax=Microvirga subterranea TaxID=186651 RepID=A0A370HS88_9HYPH|nr:YcaO-like family protein [Microvirga subterranea]RDI60801.1 ribosomal protein S12 methylthiotransferase accessory factor [Microvirga subterranea]